eukprot:TRINITY_DN12434_c0_g1_i2.p1 TRINITY_DN12434_c0_g1~~TRINITY_DN12434_c0_g1_i2.p1  ORF type:complete len:1057 (+),score=360.81 TRINITY_DN12434_c0_g1_i2:1475-4645(+)
MAGGEGQGWVRTIGSALSGRVSSLYSSVDEVRGYAPASLPELRERVRRMAGQSATRVDQYLQDRPSADYTAFCRRIGECRTVEDEEGLVEEEVEALERGGGTLKETVARYLLLSMLGYTVPDSHVRAAELCGSARTASERRLGLAAMDQLTPRDSPLRTMVAGTISKDARSASWVLAAGALATLRHAASPQWADVVSRDGLAATRSADAEVRARAALCVHGCWRGLDRGDVREAAQRLLSDDSPRVISAAVHIVLATKDGSCLPPVRQIHRALLDRRLPVTARSAPHLLRTILRVYGAVDEGGGAEEGPASLPSLLAVTLRDFVRSESEMQVGTAAAMAEAVRTVGLLRQRGSPAATPAVVEQARACLGALLCSPRAEYRYAGLRVHADLPVLSPSEPAADAVLGALRSPDATIADAALRCAPDAQPLRVAGGADAEECYHSALAALRDWVRKDVPAADASRLAVAVAAAVPPSAFGADLTRLLAALHSRTTAGSRRERRRRVAVWASATLPLLSDAAARPAPAVDLAVRCATQSFDAVSISAKTDALRRMRDCVADVQAKLPPRDGHRRAVEASVLAGLDVVCNRHLRALVSADDDDHSGSSESGVLPGRAAEAGMRMLEDALAALAKSGDGTTGAAAAELHAVLSVAEGVDALTTPAAGDLIDAQRRADCFSFLADGDSPAAAVDRQLRFLDGFVRSEPPLARSTSAAAGGAAAGPWSAGGFREEAAAPAAAEQRFTGTWGGEGAGGGRSPRVLVAVPYDGPADDGFSDTVSDDDDPAPMPDRAALLCSGPGFEATCTCSCLPDAVLVHLAVASTGPPLGDVVVTVNTAASGRVRVHNPTAFGPGLVQREGGLSVRADGDVELALRVETPQQLRDRPAFESVLTGSVKAAGAIAPFRAAATLHDFARPVMLTRADFRRRWEACGVSETARLMLPEQLQLTDPCRTAAVVARKPHECWMCCEAPGIGHLALVRFVEQPPGVAALPGFRDVTVRVRSTCRSVAAVLAHTLAPHIDRRILPGCYSRHGRQSNASQPPPLPSSTQVAAQGGAQGAAVE